VRQFSTPHLAALAVLAVAAPATVLVARRCSDRVVTIVFRALAVAILAVWAGEYVADVVQGIWTVRHDLPLQLTDVISVLTAVALWTRSRRAAEFVYLWSLSASLQATLTPDLAWDFPSVFYFTYFTYHIVAVVAGVGLVFGCRLYPRPGAPLRVFAATLAWAAVAGAGDLVTGGNYMYLRAKPAHGSLLSALGPWPWYLVGIGAVGLAMLIVLQSIANVVRRRDHRAAPELSRASAPATGRPAR
jgi:hypothetical integral membrane protein (TIGR02206 family)